MGVEGSILVLVLVLVLVFLLVMGVVVKGTILRDLKTFIDDGYYKSQRERALYLYLYLIISISIPLYGKTKKRCY